jgi:hypothetical protein
VSESRIYLVGSPGTNSTSSQNLQLELNLQLVPSRSKARPSKLRSGNATSPTFIHVFLVIGTLQDRSVIGLLLVRIIGVRLVPCWFTILASTGHLKMYLAG